MLHKPLNSYLITEAAPSSPLHQPGQVLGLRRQSGVRGPPDRGAGEGDRGVEQSNASLSHPVYMKLNFYNTQIL